MDDDAFHGILHPSHGPIVLDVETAMLGSIDKAPKTCLFCGLSDSCHFFQVNGTVNIFIPNRFLSLRSGSKTARLHHVLSSGDCASSILSNMRARGVLFHDMYEKVFRHVLGQPFYNMLALFFLAWHNEVSDQHALLRDTVCCEAQISNLSVHGLDALHSNIGVVVRFQESL